MALLWGLGFLSLGGLLGGVATLVHVRGRREERLARRIAQAAIVLGSIGFIATLVVAGPELFRTQ